MRTNVHRHRTFFRRVRPSLRYREQDSARGPQGLCMADGTARQEDAPRAHHRDNHHHDCRRGMGGHHPDRIRDALHCRNRFLNFPDPRKNKETKMYTVNLCIAHDDWGRSVMGRTFTRRGLKKFIHRHAHVIESVHSRLYTKTKHGFLHFIPAEDVSRKPMSGWVNR